MGVWTPTDDFHTPRSLGGPVGVTTFVDVLNKLNNMRFSIHKGTLHTLELLYRTHAMHLLRYEQKEIILTLLDQSSK